MADRFFLNIGTSWNATANWSTTSGGAGGASIPTTSDVAIFDVNSGNCNIDVNAVCSKLELRSTYINTVTQNSTFTISISGSWSIQCDGGAFVGGDSLIDCEGDVIINGGAFTSTSGTLDIKATNGSDFLLSSGSFTHNNGLVKITGSNHHSVTNNVGNPFYNFEDDTCPTCTLSGTLFISNDFIVTSNGVINALMTVEGNASGSGTVSGSGKIILTGTNVQQYSIVNIPTLEINKAGGSVDFQIDIFIGKDWTWIAGTLNWSTYKCTFNNAGTHAVINGGTFNNVVIAKGTTSGVSLASSNIIIEGDLSLLVAGSIVSGTIDLKGNLYSEESTWGSGTWATITFNGTANQTFSGVGSVPCDVIIDKVTGDFDLLADMLIDEAGNDFTINQGVVNLNTFDLNIISDSFIQNGGTYNGGTGKIDADVLAINAGVFNQSSAGEVIDEEYRVEIGAVYNRHVSALIDSTPGAGSAFTLDVNGNSISNIELFHGAFNVVIDSDVVVMGDFNKSAGTGFFIGTGFVYFRGQTFTNSSFHGGGSSSKVVVDGTIDQFIIQNESAVSDGFPNLLLQKASGNVTLQATTGIFPFSQDFIVDMDAGRVLNVENIILRAENFSGGSNANVDMNGVKVGGFILNNGAFDLVLISDLNILGEFLLESGSNVFGSGININFYGDYRATISAVSTSLASAPNLKFVGSVDQNITTITDFRLIAGIVTVDKPSGSVIQQSNIIVDNSTAGDDGNHQLNLFRGIWCTNEFDLTVDGNLLIVSPAELQKTPLSTITSVSTIGTVTNVTECGKKNSILAIL